MSQYAEPLISNMDKDAITALQARIHQLEARLQRLEVPTSRNPYAQINSPSTAPEPFRPPIPEMATEPKPIDSVKVRYVIKNMQENGSYQETKGQPPFDGSISSDSLDDCTPPLTFSTQFGKDGNRQSTTITIESKGLIELMQTTMQDMLSHAGQSPWKGKSITVTSGSHILIHSLNSLHKAASDHDGTENNSATEEARKELRTFLRHVEAYESELIQGRNSIRKTKEITWAYSWALFPPGAEVVARPFADLEQIFIVSQHVMKGNEFVVSCWTYDWNGIELVKHLYEFAIPYFIGTKSVTLKDLPCIPLAYYGDKDVDQDKLRQHLIERGKRFKDLYVRSDHDEDMFRCCGPIIVSGELDKPQPKSPYRSPITVTTLGGPKSDKSDVVIDASLYAQYAPSTSRLGSKSPISKHSCDCQLCSLSGLRKCWEELFKKPGSRYASYSGIDQESYEKFFSLLPPRVLGYVMDLKKWAQLPVNSMESCDNTDAKKGWDELSLEADHKNAIRRLVSAHIDRTQLERPEGAIIKDIIPGKGEGLVILLHGLPGVGKTMTAETLARSLKRPLLRIDASDFDYGNAMQVSNALKTFFHLAHSWGAILLMDEADVFLQTRLRAEIQQNALVSVLLRHLEYFRGVLIMTTNRIMSIDIAVQSRIHYAVRFGSLKDEQIRNIWNTFRNQLDDSNSSRAEIAKIDKYFKENLPELKSCGLNGRDIRNVFTSAQLIAATEGGQVTSKHIKNMVRSTMDFRRDLEKWRTTVEAQTSVIKDT